MSDFMVKISSMEGESQLRGFEKQIECVACRHAIDLPVVAQGNARIEGSSRQGALELDHTPDLSSPPLRAALAKGTNLGEVVITRLRTAAGESKPAEVIKLQDVFVVRIDLDTPVDPVSNRPSEDPIETFALEYSSIQWEYKRFVDGRDAGSVFGAWNAVAQTSEV